MNVGGRFAGFIGEPSEYIFEAISSQHNSVECGCVILSNFFRELLPEVTIISMSDGKRK